MVFLSDKQKITILDNKIIILKQMQNSMRLSYYKRLGKNQPTQYIFNQQASDQQLSILLNLLTEFDSVFQLGQFRKSKQITKRMSLHLARVDSRHRSFWKAKSLVLGCCILVHFQFEEFTKAYELIQQQNQCSLYIHSNQYSAKSLLFRVLFLMIKPVQFVQEKIMNWKQVETNYKKFSKIKLESSYVYYDTRLWEQFIIVQILVYQYILIVQKLAEFDEVKASYLYTKGLHIARNLLGKDHKFTVMMNRITKIRKQTNKLLRMESVETVSSTLFKSTSKSTRFKTKNKKNLLKSISNKRTHSEMDNKNQSQNFSSSLYKSRTLNNSDCLWAVRKVKKQKYMISHQKAANLQIDNINQAVSKFEQDESINDQKPEFKSIFTRKKKRDILFKRGGFILNQQTLIKQREEKIQKLLEVKIGDSQKMLKIEQQPKKSIITANFTQQKQRKIQKQIPEQNPENSSKKPITKRAQTPYKIPIIKKKQQVPQQSEWSCQLI